MFTLTLSDMRAPKIEYSDEVVAWADTREALEDLMRRERVETYRDGRFQKSFRQGGPLEWYNPERANLGQDLIDSVITEEEYLSIARLNYAREIEQLTSSVYRA